MLDMILKVFALAAFVASLLVIVVYVPAPDLVIALLLVVAMAIYDFLIRPLFRRRNNNHR
jgi:hypothetical protein